MKKIVVLFLSAILLFSCISGPVSDEISINDVITRFAYGLEEKNIDILMDTYWPEAVFTFFPPEGEEVIFRGSEEIRSGQLGSMENPAKLIVRIDTAENKKTGMTVTYTILVESTDFILTNILELEKRNSEWRIIKQVVKF